MDSGDQKSASSAASGSFFSAIASSVRSWGSAMQKSVNGYGGAADLSFFFLVSLSNRINKMSVKLGILRERRRRNLKRQPGKKPQGEAYNGGNPPRCS
ncbi:hypothetical protein GW17_00023779 [Ensete ventricosum]|nr:hypothetical protein GW17_00023779 [Ensete ventricosum]